MHEWGRRRRPFFGSLAYLRVTDGDRFRRSQLRRETPRCLPIHGSRAPEQLVGHPSSLVIGPLTRSSLTTLRPRTALLQAPAHLHRGDHCARSAGSDSGPVALGRPPQRHVAVGEAVVREALVGHGRRGERALDRDRHRPAPRPRESMAAPARSPSTSAPGPRTAGRRCRPGPDVVPFSAGRWSPASTAPTRGATTSSGGCSSHRPVR